MIETIFYFPEKYSEYEANLRNISDRTITFVKDTKQIFKGREAEEYGSATIKPATTTSLGGIKLYKDSEILPSKTYPVRLDSDNRAFVSVPWISQTSDGTVIGYDDSELRSIIAALNRDLDDISAIVDADAINTLKRTITEYNKILEEFGASYSGGIPWRWDEELEGFIQQVIKTNATGDGATWSTIIQKFDEIEARVSNVERVNTISINGQEATLESLISDLHLYIDDATGAAIANLKTEWALTNDDMQALRWLVSGFNSQTTSSGTFADIYSRGVSESSDAISALRTKVTAIDDSLSGFVSIAELATRVENITSGLYMSSDGQTALASLIASAGENTFAGLIIEAINNATSQISIDADKINLNGVAEAVSDIIIGEDVDLTSGNLYLKNGKSVIWHNGSTGGAAGARPYGSGSASITFDGSQWVFSPALSNTSGTQATGISGTIHALGADFTVTNGLITATTAVDNLTLSLS